jgi:hypothetical protein
MKKVKLLRRLLMDPTWVAVQLRSTKLVQKKTDLAAILVVTTTAAAGNPLADPQFKNPSLAIRADFLFPIFFLNSH